MDKLKPYLITAIIAFAVFALISRVDFLKKIATGGKAV